MHLYYKNVFFIVNRSKLLNKKYFKLTVPAAANKAVQAVICVQ